jgi:uncharacterized protein (TIGR00251 family)
VLLSVWVTPGAQRTVCAGEREGYLRVRLRAPAREGRANDELVRALAGWLGVGRDRVTLVAGAKARRKVARVAGGAAGVARLTALLTER